MQQLDHFLHGKELNSALTKLASTSAFKNGRPSQFFTFTNRARSSKMIVDPVMISVCSSPLFERKVLEQE